MPEDALAVSESPAFIVAVTEIVSAWGRQHRASYPWRGSEVPLWQKLVAEVMLLRTRAQQVVPVWEQFARRFPSTKALREAGPSELAGVAAGLGLSWREGLLQELLVELGTIGDELPLVQNELVKLPGVGDYCAAALLSLHADRRAVIIDANVVRVLARLVGKSFDGETRRRRWLRELAARLTPEAGHQDYNYGLLDIAMTICRRPPRCSVCPLRPYCATGRAVPVGSV
ncbi:MAG TPA: hypothetical protein PKA49_03790 [Tepidiformaceae bacterium]|nr:hypothetical protein [Tepidiformaceae bacterium]